jgi:hypothetical protein
MKPKTEPKKQTQASLAGLLGVSRQLISCHVKAGGAPPLDDLAGWTAHLAARGRTGSLPPDLRRAIGEQRLAILKATKARLERENAVAARALMPVADAKRQASFACCYFFEELAREERELPPRLAGLSAVEVFKHLHAFNENLRREAKLKFEAIGDAE